MKRLVPTFFQAGCFGLTLTFATTLAANDWPQWRGPTRDGISTETGLLKEWPKEGPKLLWQIQGIGSGFSTPAVVGKRLYVLGNEGLENESVHAFATADGAKAWSTRLGKVGKPAQNPSYPAARSTPTVDGELTYALGSAGDLVCLATASGEIKWQKNLVTDFEGQSGIWAYSESPLIDGSVLVCTPGGSNATLVALNKKDGAVIWKAQVPGGDAAAYASAMVVENGGVKQYVQFVSKGLVGVEAKTGKFLWRYDHTAKGSMANIPTPVAADGAIYTSTGRSGGGLVNLKASDGKFEAEEAYFTPKMPTSIGGAIKRGKYLYGTTGQALVCGEFATGTIKWEERSVAPASLCYADERLYLHGENGDLALVEVTPEGYREKGRFTPADQPERGSAKAWAYPVVANGRLYIRDAGSLWCYDVSKSGSSSK